MQDGRSLVLDAATIVRIGGIVNRLFLAALAIGLAATFLAPGFFGRVLIAADATVDVPEALTGVRLLMLLGVATAIVTDRLLAPLGAFVAAIGTGDPFLSINARRLQAIGWALLGLQLLDIPFALLARFWPSLGSAAPSGDISVGGWIATLMVFVLARAFAAGSVMRDDLAGTV